MPSDFSAQYAPALIRSAELRAVKKHLEYPSEFSIQTHIGWIAGLALWGPLSGLFVIC